MEFYRKAGRLIFSNLLTLRVSDNIIEKINLKLDHLIYLDISKNSLTGIYSLTQILIVIEIPPLNQLPRLKRLNLSQNSIVHLNLGKEISSCQFLEVIDVSSNRFDKNNGKNNLAK